MTDTRKPVPPPSFPPGQGFAPKPGLDGKGDMHDPKKGGRQHRRNLASPCDRPPATPTGVRMHFRAIEAKTHLNFKANITWDDVTTDTSGLPINTVDRWDIEWRARDSDGDPVEIEHSALVRAWNPSGTNFHFKTARAISPDREGGFEWHVGDRVKITGCFPETNYNGTWTIASFPASDEFVVDSGHISGELDAKRVGEVFNLSTDEHYRRKLRNPQRRIALRKAEFVVKTSDHSGVTDAHNPSGTTYRFNTGPTNDYQVGDYVKVENMSPNAYNGVWHVTNRIDSDTFEVNGDTSSVGAGTTGDVYIAKTAYRYTTRGDNGFNLGQKTKIKDCRPETAYNGTWEISNIIGTDQFEVMPNRAPNNPLLDAEVLGVAIDEADFPHVVVNHLPRPKTWYWQARVRCRSGEGCWSAFSSWTTAVLPWDGADPKPPVPTYGTFPITFDHKGKGKHRKIRLLFTFDEVRFWDVPGGDREDDVAAYDVQLDTSTNGVNWDDVRDGGAPYRTHSRPANDDDADTTRTAVFGEIHRSYWYRCRVRTRDRFHRKGDWSAWTDPALPFDDIAPPTPTDVEVFPASTDRVVVAWEDPTKDIPCVGTVSGTSGTATLTGTGSMFHRQVEAGTLVKVVASSAGLGAAPIYTVKKITSPTSLTLTTDLASSPTAWRLYEVTEDPDVAVYAVQIAKFADVDTGVSPNEWSEVYAHDRAEGRRKGFKIKDADVDETFFARVRSIDAAGNRSVWVPAWVRTEHSGNANSDPDVDGDGVVVVPGGNIVTATWTYPGRLDIDALDLDADGDTTEAIAAPYEIPTRFENQTGIRQYFQNCALTCGDKEAGTGAPTGTGIIVQMRRWETDETTAHTLFDPTGGDDRPKIGTNDFRGRSNTFQAGGKFVEPGEAVSCTLFQFGATHPGSNLRAQLTMSPAAPVEH